MEAIPAFDQDIYKRQIGYVYKFMPSTLIVNLVVSAVLVFIQWPVIEHPILVLWFSCIMTVCFFRMISAYLFKKKNHLFVSRQWGNIYILLLFLSGILWGAAGIYLFPEKEVGYQIMVAFVVGGMAAGASVTASAVRGAFFFYLIPALAPLFYQYMISPGPIGISMCVMLVIFACIFITISRYVYGVTLDSIVFGESNTKESEARKKAEATLEKEQDFIEAVLANVEDGIVACDEIGVVTLFNRAARKFHGLEEQYPGEDKWAPYCDLYLADGKTPMKRADAPLYQAFQGEQFYNKEMVIIPKDGKKRTLLASGQPLLKKNGEKIGAVVSMNDITDQKEAQTALQAAFEDLELKVQERTEELIAVNRDLRIEIEEKRKIEQDKETLILELREAIERIKTLSGIVPICMYCKQIRDDKGYWNNLEKFISEHSEAQFSHSICPKCATERYPDYIDKE